MDWQMNENGVQVNVTNENIAFHTINELKRLNSSINDLSKSLEEKLEKKVDKQTAKWNWILIFGSFSFTMFVLITVLKMHMPGL